MKPLYALLLPLSLLGSSIEASSARGSYEPHSVAPVLPTGDHCVLSLDLSETEIAPMEGVLCRISLVNRSPFIIGPMPALIHSCLSWPNRDPNLPVHPQFLVVEQGMLGHTPQSLVPVFVSGGVPFRFILWPRISGREEMDASSRSRSRANTQWDASIVSSMHRAKPLR